MRFMFKKMKWGWSYRPPVIALFLISFPVLYLLYVFSNCVSGVLELARAGSRELIVRCAGFCELVLNRAIHENQII